ncbi:MAG: LytTR family transcriptional regulator DNA-binding domain-containing protein [Spirosomataceae bacterium]
MKKIIFPPSEKILYLKGYDNYTEFHLTDMSKEVSSYTLKKHQTAHSHFLRITRAYLINPSFIRKIYDLGRTKAVELSNGEIIVVSRRRKEVLDAFRD